MYLHEVLAQLAQPLVHVVILGAVAAVGREAHHLPGGGQVVDKVTRWAIGNKEKEEEGD